MNRLSYRFDNDWRWLRDSGGIDLLRLSFVNDGWHVSIAVALLGFGIGLTYWKQAFFNLPEPTPAPEPIEHDGWAGEPQGREHGA